MRLGIDFGTTRTVVAAADRGNFPIVTFDAGDDGVREWFPAYVAAPTDDPSAALRFGFDAEGRIGEAGWQVVRGIKRELAAASVDTVVEIGAVRTTVGEVLVGYLRALREAVVATSSATVDDDEAIEVLVSVPANANSNQRFLTLEAFRAAGFVVLGLLNEPSAAGIEFVQRFGKKALGRGGDALAVYDLGGGTFDVSVIRVGDGSAYEVIASEGIGRLGGDDFDDALLALALEEAGIDAPIDDAARAELLAECRERKEGLHANSRKIAIDVGRAIDDAPDATVRVKAFEERVAPLIARTMDALDAAVERADATVGAIYLVGGATGLPAVLRAVKKRWGRRVRRSPYPFAATAVGLAIATDTAAPVAVAERFTRHFGVWREADDGARIVFDSIFPKDTPLPATGEEPLRHARRYRAAHDVGHYRYLECTEIDASDAPAGDVSAWDEVRFPIDPSLAEAADLANRPVHRLAAGTEVVIEEEYACDATGAIEVTIRNRTAGFERAFRLRA